jgi:ADP-ribose pyrophosphatase
MWGCIQSVFAASSLESYFSYMEKLPSLGNYQEGEIEIIQDPLEIEFVQKIQEKRWLKKGFLESDAKEFSRIGVIAEDPYWVWLRDAVYFPNKIPGTYDRLVWKSELNQGRVGVAILPVLESGKLLLNLNYRHATRSWELELPRGRIDAAETLEEAALREMKEETGYVASSVVFLGDMAPDSGVLSSIIPVFLGRVVEKESANPEYSEAILGTFAFSKEEIKQGLCQGFLEISIQGERKRIPLRDSFLAFAILQAEIRDII